MVTALLIVAGVIVIGGPALFILAALEIALVEVLAHVTAGGSR